MTAARKHAITPSDSIRPDRRGIFPATDWRQTNPDYQRSAPRVSPSGRLVEIDAGTLADYVKQNPDVRELAGVMG